MNDNTKKAREDVARAICKACEENPESLGDAHGNEKRWQDYLVCADAAIAALSENEQASSAGGQEPIPLYAAPVAGEAAQPCLHQWATTGGGSGSSRRSLACQKCGQHRDHIEQADALALSVGYLSFNSMRQCAAAWLSIVSTLDRLFPQWYGIAGTRVGSAVAAIEALATKSVHAVVQAAPQDVDLEPLIVRPLAEWHEDDGNVMWWAWCGNTWAGEPGWYGQPRDSDWPGYHTHWTAHPKHPALIDSQHQQEESDA